MMEAMSIWEEIRWRLVGGLGRLILSLWSLSSRFTVLGEEAYQKLREEKKPVIIMIWHGRIFLLPYFFRNRGIMPLISPSGDGEIPARIMSGWGYKILRGSGSHTMVTAWKQMVRELNQGGEVIIVPDGPRGPDRVVKPGGLKLAQQSGAVLVPFTFSTTKKKILKSWDRFLMFYPFRRVVAVYGNPIQIARDLDESDFEHERLRIEKIMHNLDQMADTYFDPKEQ